MAHDGSEHLLGSWRCLVSCLRATENTPRTRWIPYGRAWWRDGRVPCAGAHLALGIGFRSPPLRRGQIHFCNSSRSAIMGTFFLYADAHVELS
jgi:hypothetical protein